MISANDPFGGGFEGFEGAAAVGVTEPDLGAADEGAKLESLGVETGRGATAPRFLIDALIDGTGLDVGRLSGVRLFCNRSSGWRVPSSAFLF